MTEASLLDRLVHARRAAGHSQALCAETLASFGAPVRSQASMSRYLNGKQGLPIDLRRAILTYIDTFGADEPPEQESAEETSPPVGEPNPDFAGMVRRLTDEPLLGPRQGALVDALISRLQNGPPLSEEDRVALTSVMHVLGIA